MEHDRNDGLIALGVVLRPVGLDGRCRVQLHGDSLSSMKFPCPVHLELPGGSRQTVTLLKPAISPKGCQCRFSEVTTIEDAERIRDATILVEHRHLPPLPQGRYYQFQLKGLKAVLSPSGQEWGTVTDLHNFPASDALEVRSPDGRVVLVPMSAEVMLSVDLNAGIVTVDGETLEAFL